MPTPIGRPSPRARIAYGGFLAWFEQRRVDPGAPPSARELRAYQRALMTLLLARL